MDIALVLGGVWIACLIAGTLLGYSHGNAAYGFFFPFILGPLGLILAVVLLRTPPTTD